MPAKQLLSLKKGLKDTKGTYASLAPLSRCLAMVGSMEVSRSRRPRINDPLLDMGLANLSHQHSPSPLGGMLSDMPQTTCNGPYLFVLLEKAAILIVATEEAF